jgi:hypothetical protein
MSWRVGVECGQCWYLTRSYRRPLWRRFPAGFAFGPIMVWKES